MSHAVQFLAETKIIASEIDATQIEKLAKELVALRERKGRLVVMGLGGSAANAMHAAADFRKLCGIQACALTESIAEITARANDEGWDTVFAAQLAWAQQKDAILVFSVGGGTQDVSVPIVRAIEEAKAVGMSVFGVVGRDGGVTKQLGHCVVSVPTVDASRVTPHTEGWQMVILHCLVSHPALQVRKTKW